WDEVARMYSRFSRPSKVSLNWFIPALVKRRVGSSAGTSDELATMRWPFLSKYFRNDERISLEVISLCGAPPHPARSLAGAPRPAPLLALRPFELTQGSPQRSQRTRARRCAPHSLYGGFPSPSRLECARAS